MSPPEAQPPIGEHSAGRRMAGLVSEMVWRLKRAGAAGGVRGALTGIGTGGKRR
jgi:hypothetical protein